MEISPQSYRLRQLARIVLAPHIDLPGCACAMIAGSAAEGVADDFSDLDLILHYHHLPTEQSLDALRLSLGGGPIDLQLGSIAEGSYLIQYKVDGVDCQLACSSVDQWEREIAQVLAGDDAGGPLHKAMYGTLSSIAVHGPELLARWQARLLAYSDTLRDAMISKHLRFFRLWRLTERLGPRDANLWMRQALVEASFNLLGVLAGLNRKYFTSFQFKRTQQFVDSLSIAPDDLYQRLESLWTTEPIKSAETLRLLVEDVVSLVEQCAPHIDTVHVRKIL